eukprot:2112127-Rhodomonas_salina.1
MAAAAPGLTASESLSSGCRAVTQAEADSEVQVQVYTPKSNTRNRNFSRGMRIVMFAKEKNSQRGLQVQQLS